MALILLRYQPGIEVFEYQFERRGGVWTDELEDWAADISDSLFGISEYDVQDIDHAHFDPKFEMMRDESDAYWAAHGWDVTDGDGKQLAIMNELTKPMVCMVEKLHPGAEFKMAADAWDSQLEADAKAFRPTR